MKARAVVMTLLVCGLATPFLAAQKKGGTKGGPKKVELPHPFYWAAPDALRGDWQGTAGYVAQVVPVMDQIYSKADLIPQQEDNGKYEVHIFKQFDQPNDKPVAVLTGTLSDGALPLEGDGWTGAIAGGHFTAKNGDQSIDLQHITRTPPSLGDEAAQWCCSTERAWILEQDDGKGMAERRRAFRLAPGPGRRDGVGAAVREYHQPQDVGDAKIHVEFRNIGGPTNSGVYIQDRYEANINETYGSLTANPNGQFDNSVPTMPGIRASRPVLEWQTFDIDFTAPRFDASGKNTADAVVTLLLNGCDP